MSIVEGGFGVVASGSLTVYSKNICNCNLIHGWGGSDVCATVQSAEHCDE